MGPPSPGGARPDTNLPNIQYKKENAQTNKYDSEHVFQPCKVLRANATWDGRNEAQTSEEHMSLAPWKCYAGNNIRRALRGHWWKQKWPKTIWKPMLLYPRELTV